MSVLSTWRPRIALYAATASLVLATAAAAVQSWRLHRETLAHSRTVTAHANEERERTELAREAYILATRATSGVDHAHQVKIEQIARVAAADRSTADSVRNSAQAIASAAGAAGATCGTDELRALASLARLVDESSALVAEGKERAAAVGAQAEGLQAYARGLRVTAPTDQTPR